MLNSIIYEVDFEDEHVKEYSTNTIADNMLTQVDSYGFTFTMMEGIIYYRKDVANAITKDDMYIVTKHGQKKIRKTTVGWKLLVQWRDQSKSWINLKYLKECHPIEVAEFDKARGIADEPTFAWWVPYTMRKRDLILSALKSFVRKTTNKYGIEILTIIKHGHRLDKENGNNFWRDANSTKIHNAGVAFEVLPYGQNPPVGWSEVTGHLIWYVKMDLTCKARWFLNGHKKSDPIGSTYTRVVSMESVRIAFTYAAPNGIEVCTSDIRDAYLQAPLSQKDYIVCGPDFGIENMGKYALVC